MLKWRPSPKSRSSTSSSRSTSPTSRRSSSARRPSTTRRRLLKFPNASPKRDAPDVASSAASGTTFTDRAASIADDTETPPIEIEPDAPLGARGATPADQPVRDPQDRRRRARPLDPRRSPRRAHARRGRPGPGRARGDAGPVGRPRADRREPRRRAGGGERGPRVRQPRARTGPGTRRRARTLDRAFGLGTRRARARARRESGAGHRARSHVVGARSSTHPGRERSRSRARDRRPTSKRPSTTRTAELEQARASLAELEAELAAHATQLDHARGRARSGPARTPTSSPPSSRRPAARSTRSTPTPRRSKPSSPKRAEPPTGPRPATSSRPCSGSSSRPGTSSAISSCNAPRPTAPWRRIASSSSNSSTRSRPRARKPPRCSTSSPRRGAPSTRPPPQVEAAERAREAITIDAADVLARAEAEATSMLERANRDAEAIRQEAALETGARTPSGGLPAAGGAHDRRRRPAHRHRRSDRASRTQAREATPAPRPDLADGPPGARSRARAAAPVVEQTTERGRRAREARRDSPGPGTRSDASASRGTTSRARPT